MDIKKEREERATRAQKDLLVNYITENKELAYRKCMRPDDKEAFKNKWEVVARELNEIGPQKSVLKWQRFWTELKAKTKKKASVLRRLHSDTGEEIPLGSLSEVEEKVLSFISKEAIPGVKVSCSPLNSSAVSEPPNQKLHVMHSEREEYYCIPGAPQEVVVVDCDGVNMMSPEGSENGFSDVSSDTSKAALRKREWPMRESAANVEELQRQTIDSINKLTEAVKQQTKAIECLGEKIVEVLLQRTT